VAWFRRQVELPLVLIGYSFGATAVCRMDADLAALILISPTLARHDFSNLARATFPKLVIHSDNDFATPLQVITAWLASLPEPKRACCIPRADHFFKGHEARVFSECCGFLTALFGTPEAMSCMD
jgi:alpha/beta superfamily hydrolase